MGRYSVLTFASFVALLVLLSAYFSNNRKTDIDELALYNPAYMFTHYGKLTYPVENYDNVPVIVHPPVHIGLIGLLSRLGATWYYAEATPTVFFLLIAIVTIVRGNFPPGVKLALLFGVGLLMSKGELFASFFGSRPEGTLHSAWFAALLLLESGRLSHWNRRKLFCGAFLLTWASSLHYYATPALGGLLVYLVWAVSGLGWKAAKPKVLALSGGALLFGLPYAALYVAPNWSRIAAAIRYHQAGADLALVHKSAIAQHFDWYHLWSTAAYVPDVLRQALGLGIPLMVFSTLLLGAVRSTRGHRASVTASPTRYLFLRHAQARSLFHPRIRPLWHGGSGWDLRSAGLARAAASAAGVVPCGRPTGCRRPRRPVPDSAAPFPHHLPPRFIRPTWRAPPSNRSWDHMPG